MDLDAPIAAVTVHPERARITRRGRAAVPPAPPSWSSPTCRPRCSTTPCGWPASSATPVRVVGVDLRHRDLADVPDDRVRAAEAAVRDAERTLAVIDGQDAADVAREQMLSRLARRSGDRLAAALADGRAGTARVGEVGAAVAAQLVEVAEQPARARRAAGRRREHVLDAARRPSWTGCGARGRQRREAVIAVEARRRRGSWSWS